MRDYDPTLGRYMQADPLGLVDGASVYGYALQNPGRYTDPTGKFIPQLLGFALGAGLEYFTNKCADWKDILFAGGFGAVGGGISKAALLRYGPRSLTREHGKVWSHGLSRGLVDRFTSGSLNRFLNRRGGLNGSWVNPKRHYYHDRAATYANGARILGPKWPQSARFVDRIPDWLKGTIGAAGVGAAISGCECRE